MKTYKFHGKEYKFHVTSDQFYGKQWQLNNKRWKKNGQQKLEKGNFQLENMANQTHKDGRFNILQVQNKGNRTPSGYILHGILF